MRMKVFAVHDAAVGLFMQPIFMRSEAEAVRALRMIGNDHTFRQSPKDYSLYYLTEYDEATGLFADQEAPPFRVAELSALLEEK